MSREAWRMRLLELATDRRWRQFWYHLLTATSGRIHWEVAFDECGYRQCHLVAALQANGILVRPLRTGFGRSRTPAHDELWIDWTTVKPIVKWLREALANPGTCEMNLGELVRIAISEGEAK